MSTSHERTLERQMHVLGFMIAENRLLRLKEFQPMLDKWRRDTGDWQLFPLNTTTVKSTLKGLVDQKLIKAARIVVGKRAYIFYKVRKAGRDAHAAYTGDQS